MKKNLVFSITLLLLAALVAAAPYSFAKVCDAGEKLMKCHWTARAELFLGLAAALLSLLRFSGKSRQFLLGLDLGIIVNAAGIILMPAVLIGVCGMASMHCHSVTRPVLIVLGILILTVASLDAALNARSRK